MSTTKSRVTTLCFALVIAASLPTMGLEEVPWNQAKVLTLTDDLVFAARQLSIQCRTSPPNYIDQDSSSDHFYFRYHVRHFLSVTSDLSQQIESGKSREETQPIFDSSMEIMTDLKKYTEKSTGGSWSKVTKAALAAENVLISIGAFYTQQ